GPVLRFSFAGSLRNSRLPCSKRCEELVEESQPALEAILIARVCEDQPRDEPLDAGRFAAAELFVLQVDVMHDLCDIGESRSARLVRTTRVSKVHRSPSCV